MKTLAEMDFTERAAMKHSVMAAIFHNFAIDAQWEPLLKELEAEGMIRSVQIWEITRAGELKHDLEPASPEYSD